MNVSMKKEKDIGKMREAGRIAARILEKLAGEAAPGVPLKTFDEVAREEIEHAGVASAFLGHDDFPATVCVSVNDVAVHGAPGERELAEGDIVGIDFGVIYEGWYSDTAVTVPVGEVSKEAEKLLAVAKEALDRGIAAARAGAHIGDISAAIQSFVEAQGFETIRELTGHGIGRELHEDPHVPNYGSAGQGLKLKPGMVLAIEPIVSVSAKHVTKDSDGFGYKTDDGSLSAHFEHTVAITKGGTEVLTQTER